MGLKAYLFKRIVYSIVLLLLVATLNFMIFILMPGDPVAMYVSGVKGLGHGEKMQWIVRLKHQLGIGDPLHIQYVKYLRNLLTWDFGLSLVTRRPVADEMVYRLPFTLAIMGGSTIFAIIIGVVLGVVVAEKRGGKFDSAMVLSSLIFYSLPTFWMGMIFIMIFSFRLNWFPHGFAYPPDWNLSTIGWPESYTLNPISPSPQALNIVLLLNPSGLLEIITGFARHMFMPLVVLTLFQYGGFLLLTRATMLEALTEDYIITARAKGLKERTVLFRHALKNASLPLITSAALSLGFILSGAIITEAVFNLPGLGQWIWNAIAMKDYFVLQAIFYIIALCVIIANFISDLLYGVIDPRIKYG